MDFTLVENKHEQVQAMSLKHSRKEKSSFIWTFLRRSQKGTIRIYSWFSLKSFKIIRTAKSPKSSLRQSSKIHRDF